MLNKLGRVLRHAVDAGAPAMMPLSDSEPCGPNLEYDPEYLLLLAEATPGTETQYGDFVNTPDGPNWAGIERDCRRLLLRSRDITLLVLLLRCRTRSAQAAGLLEGLSGLLDALVCYPEHIHPQLRIDGERDTAMRANALAALADTEGLLADIRDITLCKTPALRLQVRDVERAFASPRSPDALSADTIQRQLAALSQARDATLTDLMNASALVARLQQWAQADLQEDAPDLSPLSRLLDLFSSKTAVSSASREESPLPDRQTAMPTAETAPHEDALHISEPDSGNASPPEVGSSETSAMSTTDISSHTLHGRQAALIAIRDARAWFELVEPSSPVAVLLRQAEKMVGKRYAEVAHSIPAELLSRWEQDC